MEGTQNSSDMYNPNWKTQDHDDIHDSGFKNSRISMTDLKVLQYLVLISRDQSRSHRNRYPLWLVASWKLVRWDVIHCLSVI